MARLHIENFFPDITPDEFWALLLDKTYDRELQPALGVKLRTELERHETDKALRRKIRMIPGFPVPPAVQKVLSNIELEYEEESTFHKDRKMLEWVIRPNILTDRVTARGQVVVKAEGKGVRRTIDGEVTVSMFGVGGIIEKVVLDNTVRSYEAASRLTNEWIKAGRHKTLPPAV
jgi:hypothetical protein